MADLLSAALHLPSDYSKTETDSPKLTRGSSSDNESTLHSFGVYSGKKLVDIEFQNLNYTIPGGLGRDDTYILKNLSGMFPSGELTAVMGPSSSGKSSLINIISGYKTNHVTGNILTNRSTRNLRRFRKMSCYIMRDDQLLPHLAVEEAILCSANLKVNEGMNPDDKNSLIEDIMDMMGLLDCRRIRTSNLNNGQRKRLAIALELVNNPPIMFFDEPTSGLDSLSTNQCVSILKQLARGGRTIVCSIQQPSAKLFEMFDNLYVLAEGSCIYKGKVQCLVPYLSTQGLKCPPYHNPADFMMEVISGEHGDVNAKLMQSVLDGTCDQYNNRYKAALPNRYHRNSSKSLLRLSKQSNGSERSSRSLNSSFNSTPSGSNSPTTPGHLIPGHLPTHIGQFTDIQKTGGSIMTVSSNSAESSSLGSSNKDSSEEEMAVKPKDERTNGCCSRKDRTFATSDSTQFKVLFIRDLLSAFRDTTLIRLRLLVHLTVGIMIGLLYLGIGNMASKAFNNTGCLFFCLLFIMFASLMPTVMTFPMEMSVFLREHLNYWYSLKSYYWAKTMADLPFQIVFPVVYGSIVYYMTNQPDDFIRFFMFLTIATQTALIGQSLGFLIRAATPLQVAVFLGPICGVPIMLFSGFFVSFGTIPKYLHWLSYLSYIRYSFQGVLHVIYGMDRAELECDIGVTDCHFQDSRDLLKEMDITDHDFYIDFLALCGFFVILRLACYIALRVRIISAR